MSFSSLCGCGRVIEPEIVTETESEETNETDAEPDTATDIAEMSEVAAGSDLENNDVHGIFMDFLNGDRSLLKKGQEDEWFIPDFLEDGLCYEYTFLDLDGDGIEEMPVQMEDSPGDFNSVFHVEDGKVVCWYSDSMEVVCFDYPLKNGSMVNEYNYNGSISYHIFKYLPNGKMEQKTFLYVREEPAYNDDTQKYPVYEINDNEVSRDEFKATLKEQVTDQMLDRKNWNIIHND